jgi:lipopolysaccharide biosynthesis protein
MSKKIAVVIAHFDPDGHVPLDLLNMIAALKKKSNEIIFVSTNINKESALTVKKLCKLISRENYGYDFWSYKVGIEGISSKKSLDSILLINSSVIYFNPEKLINKFFHDSPSSPALYGLTESYQIEQHVQSFWIEFCTNELINSKAFDVWWSELMPISEPLEVIKKYEIGMSNYFQNLGVNLKALYTRSPGDQILAACRSIADDHYDVNSDQKLLETGNFSLPLELAKKINPTSILWDVILENYDWIKVKTFDRANRDFRVYKFLKYLEKNIDAINDNIEILISRKLDYVLKK